MVLKEPIDVIGRMVKLNKKTLLHCKIIFFADIIGFIIDLMWFKRIYFFLVKSSLPKSPKLAWNDLPVCLSVIY